MGTRLERRGILTMVNLLSSLSGPVIVLLSLALWVAFTLLSIYLLDRFVPDDAKKDAGYIAGKYMTAFGSIFAFLTAFLINTEYATLKSAQSYVGEEVAAATQVASASATLTPPDAERIQETMTVYLKSLPGAEWNALKIGRPELSPSDRSLNELQQQVYELADSYPDSAAALDAMSSGVEEMTQARRQWIVLASSSIPTPLLILCIAGGMVMIVNALVLAVSFGRRFSWVAAGLVLIVALDIAAILAITAPFRGPFVTKSAPISQLADEIDNGTFAPWVRSP